MDTTIDELVDNFSMLDDWEDRYRYVIELGQALPSYPEQFRDDQHKVNGCVSQVWLHADIGDTADPTIQFAGDSDAHIVRGLVAIMIIAMSGKRASEINDFDIESTVSALGLDEHLTPQRSNGLRAMIDRMKQTAHAAVTH